MLFLKEAIAAGILTISDKLRPVDDKPFGHSVGRNKYLFSYSYTQIYHVYFFEKKPPDWSINQLEFFVYYPVSHSGWSLEAAVEHSNSSLEAAVIRHYLEQTGKIKVTWEPNE